MSHYDTKMEEEIKNAFPELTSVHVFFPTRIGLITVDCVNSGPMDCSTMEYLIAKELDTIAPAYAYHRCNVVPHQEHLKRYIHNGTEMRYIFTGDAQQPLVHGKCFSDPAISKHPRWRPNIDYAILPDRWLDSWDPFDKPYFITSNIDSTWCPANLSLSLIRHPLPDGNTDEIVQPVSTQRCPKCGSDKVDLVDLVLKCADCWHIW